MSSQIENVTVDLRNLDGITLEGGNGGESSTSDEKVQAAEDMVKIHNKGMDRWNTLFIIAFAFGVFVDPLFCYTPIIREESMCFNYDYVLFWTYCGLRTACDAFYVIDIIISVCRVCKKCKGYMCVSCCKPSNMRKEALLLKEGKFMKRWMLQLSILPRLFVSLPVIAVLFASFGFNFDPLYVIIIIMPFQYILRIFLIYQSQRWRTFQKSTGSGRWLKPLLDFLPFILASHLVGALWYRLAVQRQIDCWKPHCEEFKGYSCDSSRNFIDECCKINATRIKELCPTQNPDPKAFDFGIYFYALQSNVTGPSNLSQKVLVSFWWALRNLSSFGSNLYTSMDPLEIFFCVVISISGMALFLVYLNARVQETQARSNQHKLKEKKQMMKPEIDLWLSKNGLSNMKIQPKNSKARKTAAKKKTLKTVIIENIHKIEENEEIDLLNIISILPVKFRKNITYLLCLASLSKVVKLADLDVKMLKVICEHMKPVIYSTETCIVKEGKPLGLMFFITQGLVWSYTTNNSNGGNDEWLKQGDFYGEELLNWAFKSPSFSALPFSTRTVVPQGKVEAFVIRASDLQSILCQFWWHFTRKLDQVDLKQWENSAASSIQAAWRNRLEKARRANYWNKFTAHY